MNTAFVHDVKADNGVLAKQRPPITSASPASPTTKSTSPFLLLF